MPMHGLRWLENTFIPEKGTIMEYDNGDFCLCGMPSEMSSSKLEMLEMQSSDRSLSEDGGLWLHG